MSMPAEPGLLRRRTWQALQAQDVPVPAVDVRALRQELKDTTAHLGLLGGTESFKVDRYSLPAALQCAASVMSGAAEFVWAPRFAVRALGIVALDRAVHSGSQQYSMVSLVRDAVADKIADDKNLGEWLRTQGPAAIGVTVARAASWAAQAYVAVPWKQFSSVRFAVSYWYSPADRDGPVVLYSRIDAEVLLSGRVPKERVLLVFGRSPAAVGRLNVVAATLKSGRAPLRHVAVDVAAGVVTAVDVDETLLRQGMAEVVAAGTALAAAAGGETLATSTGLQCRTCARLAVCADGTEWVARTAEAGVVVVLDGVSEELL
jgi:hypothetical protein